MNCNSGDRISCVRPEKIVQTKHCHKHHVACRFLCCCGIFHNICLQFVPNMRLHKRCDDFLDVRVVGPAVQEGEGARKRGYL